MAHSDPLLKAGGLIIALGVVMLTIGFVGDPPERYVLDDSPAPGWVIPVMIAAVAALAIGAIVFLVGISRSKREFERGIADISPIVESHALPFSVCAHCRIVIDLPFAFACPRCDSASTTVRVETDVDRSTALAALGPPP